LSDSKLQLGAHVTGGLGAGAKPEIGEKAAHESLDEVMQYLEGSNMAFITAGMGGGTGTGAAPVIAKACRDSGILTVGVVTKPFHFEGTHRMKQAEAGIEEMQDYVDTLIVIPNQNLFRVANEKTTFAEAFKMADGVLQSGVRGVTDLMVMPGLINLDFADIRSAMLEMGKAMIDSNANIIFGSTFDEKLEGSMRVSVVATGIDAAQSMKTSGGSSTVKVTAVSKAPEKQDAPVKSEPAQPQTEVARAMTLSARQQTATSTQPSVAENKTDMFAQQEFHAAAPSPQSAAMRGVVHQGSFIPPSPVRADVQEEPMYSPAPVTAVEETIKPQVQQQPIQQPMASSLEQSSNAQTQVISDAIPAPTQNLVLRPPVPGAATAERRRTPSLFERITGAYDAYKSGSEGKSESEEGGQGSSGGFHSGLRAERTQNSPSQGKLNIDSPSAPQSNAEEDLDIPAFLRRQAN